MDERGAFVHRNENHAHVVMGGIYVNTLLLSLFRSPSLFITLCHTHTYKLKPQNNPPQFDLVDTTNQWWVTFSHQTCKYRWINIQCANIYCLNTHRLSCLFICRLLDEVEVRSAVISSDLHMNRSSAWADESDCKQEVVFLVWRSQSSSFSHWVLLKWTEMVDMATVRTQA